MLLLTKLLRRHLEGAAQAARTHPDSILARDNLEHINRVAQVAHRLLDVTFVTHEEGVDVARSTHANFVALCMVLAVMCETGNDASTLQNIQSALSWLQHLQPLIKRISDETPHAL